MEGSPSLFRNRESHHWVTSKQVSPGFLEYGQRFLFKSPWSISLWIEQKNKDSESQTRGCIWDSVASYHRCAPRVYRYILQHQLDQPAAMASPEPLGTRAACPHASCLQSSWWGWHLYIVQHKKKLKLQSSAEHFPLPNCLGSWGYRSHYKTNLIPHPATLNSLHADSPEGGKKSIPQWQPHLRLPKLITEHCHHILQQCRSCISFSLLSLR